MTPERVAEMLQSEGLQYRLESAPIEPGQEPSTIVRTGFANAAIAFIVDGDNLVVDSMWRGEITKTEAPRILSIINEWNQTQYMPTLRFFENSQGEGHLTISAYRQINIVEGLSRNQTGAFIMSSLDGVLRAFEWVGKQLPELVTWEEPNHDH